MEPVVVAVDSVIGTGPAMAVIVQVRSFQEVVYVVRIDSDLLGTDRTAIFNALRAEGIGVNVHYVPVHLHPYYRDNFATEPGQCPVAERAYEEILSLPMFPRMSDEDANSVVAAFSKIVYAPNLVS